MFMFIIRMIMYIGPAIYILRSSMLKGIRTSSPEELFTNFEVFPASTRATLVPVLAYVPFLSFLSFFLLLRECVQCTTRASSCSTLPYDYAYTKVVSWRGSPGWKPFRYSDTVSPPSIAAHRDKAESMCNQSPRSGDLL